MINPTRNYDYVKGEVLLFDKGLAWTSSDLVQKVRNTICHSLGLKKLKVGHAGTLDPLATGLMILCTGRETKKIDTIQEGVKEYIALIKIGATTPSFDCETCEDQFFDYSSITKENLVATLNSFVGTTEQVPPVYSAIKIDGKRAYNFARNGENVKLKPRKVVIELIELISFEPPLVEIRIVCSKGTYIRAIARDLGSALKCGAYLSRLRRTKIGEFSIENAVTIEYFLNNIDSFVTNT
jgi:tRNA pseudouridine55 synthase